MVADFPLQTTLQGKHWDSHFIWMETEVGKFNAEMAPLVKCLPCKHEDICLDPPHTCKNLDIAAKTLVLETEREENPREGGSRLSSVSKTVGFRLSERLSQKIRQGID